MKRYKHINLFLLLLLSVLFFEVNSCFGQDKYFLETPKTFYGGLLIGTNFTQVDGDDFAGYDKTGLNVGAIVYTTLDENVAASMEILYSQKGSEAHYAQILQPGIYFTNYGIKLNYAEIPIMINYFVKHKSNVGAGLSYSRLANSSEYITTSPPQYFDLNKYPFKKDDLNLLLGGNVHFWKGLYLNIRFQYSLLSIRDKIPQDYSKAAQYNNLWVIRLMYLFY